jgi:hypothetical protein
VSGDEVMIDPAFGHEDAAALSPRSVRAPRSHELTAFACVFPRLIWATWATKEGLSSNCSRSCMYQ